MSAMSERYGAEFRIEPSDSSGPVLLEDVASVAIAWLREGTGLPPLSEEVGDWEYADGSVSVRRERNGELSVFELVWLYRSDAGEWTVEVRLSTSGGGVEAGASLRTTATVGAEQRGIGLTPQLIDRYDCRRDGARLLTASRRMGSRELAALLLRADRTLPIVAVSERNAGETLLNSDELQQRLAGVAHVAQLDVQAAQALADDIGRSRSCYNGAVRLYLPSFTTRDPSSRHPFWLASEVQRRGGQAAATIVAQARRAAAESVRGTAFAEVQSEIRSLELERLHEALELHPENQRELVKSLQRRVAQEQKWREDALRELARVKSEYEQTQRDLDRLRTEDERAQQARELTIETVQDAVQRADAQRGEHLAFLPNAFTSSEVSRYPQPMLIFDALMKLRELGAQLYAGEIQAVEIVKVLNEDNIECSTESVDTMNRYREQRLFRDETQRVIEMPLHIKFGGGSGQDNRARIHFAWDADYGQILVGHVGRHLRTGKS